MGSSYSSRTSNHSGRRGIGSNRSKISDSESVSKTRKDEDNNVEKSSGGAACERKDSKKYWITHVKFRRRSSNDLRKASSEKKAEARVNPKSTPTAEEQNSKIVQKEGLSEPETIASKNIRSSSNTNTDNGITKGDSSGTSGQNEKDGIGANSTVTSQSVDPKWQSLSNIQLYNILNDGALSPCICDPTYIMLVDARSKQDFQNNHIIMSKHASEIDNTLQASHIYGISSNSNLSNFTWVVIYGDGVTDGDENNPELKLMKELEGNTEIEPLLLTTGFKSFHNTFPFMCSDKERVNYKSLQVYPSIIIDDKLYQGRGDQATNPKVVNDLQITHIVNITQEHKNAFPEKVKYLTLKLDDVSHTQLIKHFDQTSEFLSDALCSGGRVLVHCNLGVSRSSTVSIAYLIQSKRWTLRQAYEFLKDRRTCMRPNRGFLQQLAIWEELKLGKKYTDPDDLWF